MATERGRRVSASVDSTPRGRRFLRSLPIRRAETSPGPEQLEQRLGASAVNELGYLDGERVGELLGQHRAGRVDRSFQLWSILNLSVWFDHWIAREEVAR
ncbi:MAG: hypothetical protein NVS1B9_10050 [Solirubrobacteraceae bacterium]